MEQTHPANVNINTSLTRLLGIRVPVVCAAMLGATTVSMALEVSQSGGFGFFGAANSTPAQLSADLASARARRSLPHPHPGDGAGESDHDDDDAPLPIGVGFIGWRLDTDEAAARALLDVVLAHRVRAVWLAFGGGERGESLGRWIEYLRARAPPAPAQGHTPLVFVQVNSVEEAHRAASAWKADVIIAQGNEAGGHGAASAPSTHTLLSSLLSSPSLPPTLPILAAGGLTTGAQIASLLALGASGAALGTRFLFTHECPYAPAHKAALVAATTASAPTVRTRAFDVARGTEVWPAWLDGRGLRNRLVDAVDAGVPHEEVRAMCAAGTAAGDAARMVVWCGTGVGLVREVVPVKELVAELHGDIVRQLQRAQRLLDA